MVDSQTVKYGLIIFLVGAALISDIRIYKIKNQIVYPFMLMGLTLNIAIFGLQGLKTSIEGIFIPIVLLFPLYLLRMLGAGDIKLFSAIGSIMGVAFILKCMIVSSLAGGLMALCIMTFRTNGRARLRYLYQYLKASLLAMKPLSYQDFTKVNDGHFPFALAVALGTLIVSII